MTREKLAKVFLESNNNNYVLQLPTGFGKTLIALKKLDKWYHKDCRILIVIPKLVLIDNWKDEIAKWNCEHISDNITFTTYVSFPKHCGDKWDVIVLDEGHHLSERCRDAMSYLKAKHILVLSATIKRDLMQYYRYILKATIYKVDVKDAIENDVLPDPKILLIPLKLDNSVYNQVIEKNIKKNRTVKNIQTIRYAEKWKYKSYNGPLRIMCTQQQYYNELSGLVEWYKQKSTGSAIMRNMWLHKAGERLKWLAQQKESLIKEILKILKNHRVLTFCQSIKQTESLGCPCVNSKVGLDALELFNKKKVKHISACAILDEGINLIDCQLGVFQMINSSDRMVCQRVGRILRHKNPVLIFPYFKNTRENEIVDDIVKDYNPSLIFTIDSNNLNDIKKYL